MFTANINKLDTTAVQRTGDISSLLLDQCKGIQCGKTIESNPYNNLKNYYS